MLASKGPGWAVRVTIRWPMSMQGKKITVGILKLEMYELEQKLGKLTLRIRALEKAISGLDDRTDSLIQVGKIR